MLRFRFTFIGLILSFLASSYAIAEIYKTVDKNGRITFSDVPPPNANAKPVELKNINTTPPPVSLPDTSESTAPSPLNYELHLLAPENGTTLLANERSLTLSVSLNQTLQDGDLLAYKLDGAILTKTTETYFLLNEPPRGEHSVTVEVINQEGKSLAQSETSTIIVMRPLAK